LKLVSDLLDLSRLEAGKITLYKTQFSINRLLYDLQLFFLLDMKNRGKDHIAFRIIPGLPDGSDMINADEMRIKQIIINLVSNAIKFTSKGEIALKYRMISPELLEFTVKDTGRGMDALELTLVFDRFKQANDSIAKEFGGTGLGLAISKEFIEMHGGKIRVESEIEKGTSFIFTLPITD
jgi:signal transduction histidine kinase